MMAIILLLFVVSHTANYEHSTKTLAQNMSEKYDIPASIFMGVSALESGWGKSRGAKQYNAYFGIKGQYTYWEPMERRHVTMSYWNADGEAKAYPNRWHSYNDFGKYITERGLYDECFKCNKLKGEERASCWAWGISRSYLGPDAPSSRKEEYYRKVYGIIQKYGFTKYD